MMLLKWNDTPTTFQADDTKVKSCLGGFDLCGYRHEDGKLYSHKTLSTPEYYLFDEWPDSITVFGNTYNLENDSIWPSNYELASYC